MIRNWFAKRPRFHAEARSASEAFLYRRLETLPETRGRFQLNADLPIAFDGWGRMEIDGGHLADPIAYRRDRRKDQLLW